jgi:hypothetical protein
MANVVSFEEFEDEREIAVYQAGLPRIVLEGKDDVRLFRTYWFPHMLDSFDFVEAADIVDGGGCTALRDAVLKSRQDNIPAFGFSDRDRLFRTREWDLLFTTDDAAFAAGTANDEFYTTLRWEVEAYLLEADLLPSWVRSHRRPPGGAMQCAAALAQAIEECEELLRAHRFFAAAHACGVKTEPQHFGDKKATDLPAVCAKALDKLEGGAEIADKVDPLVQTIMDEAPGSPPDRLQWLLRYVDTKRLLYRLEKRYRAEPEVRWFLAELMLQGDRRPREIERRLLELRDQLAA